MASSLQNTRMDALLRAAPGYKTLIQNNNRGATAAAVAAGAAKGGAQALINLLSKPKVQRALKATCTGSSAALLVSLLFVAIGFGPLGPMEGMLAPIIQSAYGGFVPPGIWFGTMQRIGMSGLLGIMRIIATASAGLAGATAQWWYDR